VIVRLASRFLLSKSSDGFLSLISWVSVVGISLGVLALTVVTSVINGFEGELSSIVSGMNGDVLLYSRSEPIANPQSVEERIRKVVPSVTAITQTLVAELMVVGPQGVSGAVLEGIDAESTGLVTSIPRRLVVGRLPVAQDEIAIGSALAEKIGAEVDSSEVRLVVPFATETSTEGTAGPKARNFRVVGIFKMGMYDYDSKFLFSSLAAAQDFLSQPGKVSSFKIKLPQNLPSRAISDKLNDYFGYPFRAKDWGQLNKNLLYAIQLEKVVIAVIMTVIIIVAAFNVVSTLMMMIHDKVRELAILKAMGLRGRDGFRLFLLIGTGLGLVGAGSGVLFGLSLSWILANTRLIELPADIYPISFLPVDVRFHEVVLIACLALLICGIATLYPSWKVAKRSPLEGLRDES
jgi:lipoprotein-releasing system permease protein